MIFDEINLKKQVIAKLQDLVNSGNTEIEYLAELDYGCLFEENEKKLLNEAINYLPSTTENPGFDTTDYLLEAIEELTNEAAELAKSID
jgi:hypothetical protein